MKGRRDLPSPLITMEDRSLTFRCLRWLYQEVGTIAQSSRPQGSVWTFPTVNARSLIIQTLRQQSECQSLLVMRHAFQHRRLRSYRAIHYIERMIRKAALAAGIDKEHPPIVPNVIDQVLHTLIRIPCIDKVLPFGLCRAGLMQRLLPKGTLVACPPVGDVILQQHFYAIIQYLEKKYLTAEFLALP